MEQPFFSRRAVLQGGGALIVAFAASTSHAAEGASDSVKLPGSLSTAPWLDSWIRLDADGAVTVMSGKAELGQGIKTALLQVAAEELELPMERLTLVTADTARTANEGYTAGSHSMQDSATAVRHAAAQMRELLMAEAARRLQMPLDRVRAENGAVLADDGRHLNYAELVGGLDQHVSAAPTSKLREETVFKVINRSVGRVDIPAKVTGGAAYVQDLRLEGMLHARVVRPPSYGARLISVDVAPVERMPGVVKVIRNGNFLAVAAFREYQAIKAMRSLAAAAQWQESASLPATVPLPDAIVNLAARDTKILDRQSGPGNAVVHIDATYTRPWQAHGSIGPSCAVAHYADGSMTVWTHTQGVYPDRAAIAELLHLPRDKVRCTHVEGSGCYGHNGADDAAGDAALIALELPGRPVRLQWMREQEHAWEPYGPAMVTKVHAALDAAGRVVEWRYQVWSNTHSSRPGTAGSLLAGQHVDPPFPVPEPKPLPLPEGGGDRNALPLYDFTNAEVVHHFIPLMPLRVSAMRALGAYMNVFSIECALDELANSASIDPVQLRLAHLSDQRARDVVQLAAARFGWGHWAKGPESRGRGFGFARYKNLAAYCAVAMEVDIDRDNGRVHVRRAVAAVDAGQIVNPDGVRNQIEGAILQSISWTLFESVGFDDRRITSVDWATYPILRFGNVPEMVEVHLQNRPGSPFLGAGEAGQGPAAAALANAIADATGVRLRDLPLNPGRIREAVSL